jgi:hypothetical protein
MLVTYTNNPIIREIMKQTSILKADDRLADHKLPADMAGTTGREEGLLKNGSRGGHMIRHEMMQHPLRWQG